MYVFGKIINLEGIHELRAKFQNTRKELTARLINNGRIDRFYCFKIILETYCNYVHDNLLYCF